MQNKIDPNLAPSEQTQKIKLITCTTLEVHTNGLKGRLRIENKIIKLPSTNRQLQGKDCFACIMSYDFFLENNLNCPEKHHVPISSKEEGYCITNKIIIVTDQRDGILALKVALLLEIQNKNAYLLWRYKDSNKKYILGTRELFNQVINNLKEKGIETDEDISQARKRSRLTKRAAPIKYSSQDKQATRTVEENCPSSLQGAGIINNRVTDFSAQSLLSNCANPNPNNLSHQTGTPSQSATLPLLLAPALLSPYGYPVFPYQLGANPFFQPIIYSQTTRVVQPILATVLEFETTEPVAGSPLSRAEPEKRTTNALPEAGDPPQKKQKTGNHPVPLLSGPSPITSDYSNHTFFANQSPLQPLIDSEMESLLSPADL